MKRRILTLAMVLALVAVLAMPMAVLASTTAQRVTGSTVPGYTITGTVDFGKMEVGDSKTFPAVITATRTAYVEVTVADTTASYVSGSLVKLEYWLGLAGGGSTWLQVTITAPIVSGTGAYSLTGETGASLTGGVLMAENDVWRLVATTGTAPGTWDPVVITLTIV